MKTTASGQVITTGEHMVGVVRQILSEHPTLNDFGFGLFAAHQRESPSKQAEILADNRRQLVESVNRIEATCQWIDAHLVSRKTINPHHSSYGLKHVAEKEIGYITNGVFIAAMIACGYRLSVDGPNAWFNVSERSCTQLYRALKGT
jgi:hypothetical protein